MKKLIFVLSLVVVAIETRAQEYSIEVPYTLQKGHIYVTATVGGIEGRYLFDTGAPTIITNSRAMKGHGGEMAKSIATDAVGNKIEGMSVVNVGTLSLGGFNIEGVWATVTEPGNVLEMLGVDGIVGSNIFPQSVLRIDSRREKIIISSSTASYGIDPRCAIPMSNPGQQNSVYIDIYVGGGMTEKVMFDTGSQSFLDLDKRTYARLNGGPMIENIATVYGASAMSIGGMQQAEESYRVRFADMRVGLGKFVGVTTTTSTVPSSLLGTRLLEYGIVTIDFPNRLFYFEPFADTAVTMQDKDTKDWDIVVVVAGDHLEVGTVWSDADPRAEVGDRVVEINGVNYENVDVQAFITTEREETGSGETHIVVRKDDGKEYKVTARKR